MALDEHNLSEVNQRAVKYSVIICFEICYDTLWKHIKKYLKENGVIKLENSPIPIFRRAHEDFLIDKEMHKRFVEYNKIRVDAAHDYSIEKAMHALNKIGDFTEDTEAIYRKMSEKKWVRKNDQEKMTDNQLIDLDDDQLRLIKEIIKQHIPNKKVWAYGSRVTREAQETSDLDLVVFNCNSDEIHDLKEELSESDVLVSVDIMDWENIPDSFKENIKQKYVVLQDAIYRKTEKIGEVK